MTVQNVQIVDFETNGDHFEEALADEVYEVPRNPLVKYPDTNAIVVQAQAQNVYYTLDGSDPDPSATPPHGFLLTADGSEVRIQITNFNKLPKFYRAADGAILQVQPVRDTRRP